MPASSPIICCWSVRPELIPFEFQYLLGVDYAVGRLRSITPTNTTAMRARSIAYESGAARCPTPSRSLIGARAIPATAPPISAPSLLIDPLANGIAGRRPDASSSAIQVGYERKLLLGRRTPPRPICSRRCTPRSRPRCCSRPRTAWQFVSGQSRAGASQGALLCQDWPGFGSVKPEHFLAAADIADDANVNGMVALLFACFGAGTPDADQFLMDLSQAGTAPPLAPKPFIAALPRRLLAHPNGSALAVIGHIDRAWGFSIQAPKVSEPQIVPFRNSLGFIMKGTPVGHAMCGQFGARFAALSALLAERNLADRAARHAAERPRLVTAWIERNDAQNYVLLGDPAARIRKDTAR